MENYLQHHGIKGQKWGIRRYQNEDGSLTEEGQNRYYYKDNGKLNIKGRLATAQARGVLYGKSKRYDREAKKLTKASERTLANLKKDDANIEKAKASGDTKKVQALSEKGIKSGIIAAVYVKTADDYMKKSSVLKQYISDIDSNTKKIGRDFYYDSVTRNGISPLGLYTETTESVKDSGSGATIDSLKTKVTRLW